MKLEVGTLNQDTIETTGEITNMGLSEDASSMVFKMFTKSVYSDPIGTVIREITSNCFDSHVEANVDSIKNPVIVELIKEISGNYMIFTDKGIGMSPHRVHNIYSTYFNSSKRDTNKLIGGYGIGGKTPLAYTQSFYVTTISEKENEIDYCKIEIIKLVKAIDDENYNNEFGTIEVVKKRIDNLTVRLTNALNQTLPKIKYVYNIFEGNKSPSLELLSLKPIDEHNGTEVKIPIREEDIYSFQTKTLRQLYYFENIIFKGFDDEKLNDYSIIKGKTFIYRGTTYSNTMHVCLGKVAYPIDWDALELEGNDYNIPVAIKIEIGELNGSGVTVSRESLDYSEDNRKIIIKKIKNVIDELKELLLKQYKNIVTLSDYYDATENFGRLNFNDDTSIFIKNIFSKDVIDFENFKYKDFKIPLRNEILLDFFKVKLNGKKPSRKYSKIWDRTLKSISDHENIYFVKDKEFKKIRLKQRYLRDKHSNTFYIIEPLDYTENDHFNTLRLKYGVIEQTINFTPLEEAYKYKTIISTKKAEKLIDDLYGEVFDLVKLSTKSYEDTVVPDDYKETKISKETLNVGIPMRDGSGINRIEMDRLIKFSGKIFYGFMDDKYTLKSCSDLFSKISNHDNTTSSYYVSRHGYNSRLTENSRGTLFVSISKQNEKYMKMLGKKAIHVKYFYQTYVSRKVNKIIDNKIFNIHSDNFYHNVNKFYYNDRIMKHIDTEIYDVANKFHVMFSENDQNIFPYLDIDSFKKHFNFDLSVIDGHELKDIKQLDWLVNITKKASKRLSWIRFPYEINPEDGTDRELINIVQLLIEK